MALLIFPPDNLAPPLAALVDPNLRKSVANRVNEEILGSQGARREAKIRKLVRLRTWAEQKAREAKKDLPAKLELGLDSDSGARSQASNGMGEDSIMHENGGVEPIVT